MNNPETLATSDTQNTEQNKHQSNQKEQSRMNNTEAVATADTQDTVQNKQQRKQKGQSRMNNTETLATPIHKTQDKINTRVTRRKNQE